MVCRRYVDRAEGFRSQIRAIIEGRTAEVQRGVDQFGHTFVRGRLSVQAPTALRPAARAQAYKPLAENPPRRPRA